MNLAVSNAFLSFLIVVGLSFHRSLRQVSNLDSELLTLLLSCKGSHKSTTGFLSRRETEGLRDKLYLNANCCCDLPRCLNLIIYSAPVHVNIWNPSLCPSSVSLSMFSASWKSPCSFLADVISSDMAQECCQYWMSIYLGYAFYSLSQFVWAFRDRTGRVL